MSIAQRMSGNIEDQKYETPDVNSEINMTPFVDIMLVLLIIFMVITPALLQGFQATLPVGDNLLERPEDKVLYLKAHSDLPYYDVLTMMDLGRDAGARVMAAVSETTPEDEEL